MTFDHRDNQHDWFWEYRKGDGIMSREEAYRHLSNTEFSKLVTMVKEESK